MFNSMVLHICIFDFETYCLFEEEYSDGLYFGNLLGFAVVSNNSFMREIKKGMVASCELVGCRDESRPGPTYIELVLYLFYYA